jgi:tetratricopeptide (TPR) repeat protein
MHLSSFIFFIYIFSFTLEAHAVEEAPQDLTTLFSRMKNSCYHTSRTIHLLEPLTYDNLKGIILAVNEIRHLCALTLKESYIAEDLLAFVIASTENHNLRRWGYTDWSKIVSKNGERQRALELLNYALLEAEQDKSLSKFYTLVWAANTPGFFNADIKLKHLKESIKFLKDSQKKRHKKWCCQAYMGLGNARDGAHNYTKALELAAAIEDKSLQAQAYIGLGNARHGRDGGIEHYRQALKLAAAIENKSLQAQAYIGLGNARDGDQKDN